MIDVARTEIAMTSETNGQPSWLSPSLSALPDGTVAAYEMKFSISTDEVEPLKAWAAEHMQLDPHADPVDGYEITSLYYDTPDFAVFHRKPGYDVHKYRLRRYGRDDAIELERKSKKDGRIWKSRDTMALGDLNRPSEHWPVGWFPRDLSEHQFRPVCVATYRRLAFLGDSETGGIRLTFDTSAFGRATDRLDLEPVHVGLPLVTDGVIVEFKYLNSLPSLFRNAISSFRLKSTGVSKFRRCLRAAGLVEGSVPCPIG